MNDLIRALQEDAARDRAQRVAAAPGNPAPWSSMDSAPQDGTLIDVIFDVASAEPGMAEFYAQGITGTATAIIENVAFLNGAFVPVVDARAARDVLAARGGFANVSGVGYGILSVTLTGWRPAAHPHE